MINEKWVEDALCAQTDPEAFFPEKGASNRRAIQVCGECEVQKQCLQYALDNGIIDGIWGGTSPMARQKMRREGRRVG